MKRLLMPGTALAAVLVLLVFVPKAMCSHTGGAQLRITGTVGSQSINVAINDGDLHSATFESSPCDTRPISTAARFSSTVTLTLNSNLANPFVTGDSVLLAGFVNNPSFNGGPFTVATVSGNSITYPQVVADETSTDTTATAALQSDSYVLQGGSPNGCDNGDAFEVTDNNPTESSHQAFVSTTLPSGFHIETHYICGNATGCGFSGTFPAMCNSNNTICAGPDTGFLTVTNNTGMTFTGSITLTGTSPTTSDVSSFCPPVGLASDSFSGPLGNGASRVFALAPDSSNCGGYTPPLTLNLAPGDGVTPYTYPVGQSTVDKYDFTPINNVGNEKLTITPVLVSRTNFSAGALFRSTTTCAPSADFTAAVGSDSCVTFQATCDDSASTSHDCGVSNPFFYNLDIHYDLPNGFNGGVVGGVSLLKAEGLGCPTSGFNKNILTGYSASLDPVPRGGGGGTSCFVSALDTNATRNVTDYQTFVGFQNPVSNTKTNVINAGKSEPLIWQQFQIDPSSGGVVPNNTMKLCTTAPNCTGNTVVVQTYPVACPGGAKVLTNVFPGNSSLQFFGNGVYDFNLKTASGDKGCFKVALIYGSGAIEFPPALFQFK